MDFSRLRQGEIIAAAGGLALFIFMFLPWFGLGIDVPDVEIPDVPGVDEGSLGAVADVDDDISGWDGLTDIDGFLIALAAGSGMALGGLAAAGKRINLGDIRRGSVTAVLGSLATALILWRLLANPGELKYGIFLGLAAAIAIAVGALMALREDGVEAIADVPGGRTKAASSAASAPAATARRATSAPARSSSSGSRSSGSRSKASTAKKKSSSTRKSTTTRKRSSGGKK